MARAAAGFAIDGGGGRYRLTGAADLSTARALLERGYAAFAGEARVELDLSGVTAADGAGLAVLLTWVTRARAAGRALRFLGIPPQLLALARVCGVEAMLEAAAPAG